MFTIRKRTTEYIWRWHWIILLFLASLACSMVGLVNNPNVEVASLSGKSYWAAETSTPIPTVTIFWGTTTAVYAPTNPPINLTIPPIWMTTTPQLTTVTPANLITRPPVWVTTTPFWVTSTPQFVTSTPEPLETTTPSLPIIRFSTPVPLETPYYRVGAFYLNQDVYVDGPNGIVFNVQNYDTEPAANNEEAIYHFVEIIVKNHTGRDDVLVPITDLLFVREVIDGDTVITGRWGSVNEPLLANNLPLPTEQQQIPLDNGEERSYTLAFVLPRGELNAIGLITDWARPVEGGIPIWFILEEDLGPDAPYVSAYKPLPPTAVIFDENNTWEGDPSQITPAPPGIGAWPTNGLVTRGYGCSEFYTGVDGAGWGCEEPTPWFHNGVDIANTMDTAVYTPIDGVMVWAGPNSTGPDCSHIFGSHVPHEGLGNYQKIAGGDLLQYFAHLSAFTVTEGSVSQGQQIGSMGSSGCSTGPHLHWMIYQSGSLIDPASWAGSEPPP